MVARLEVVRQATRRWLSGTREALMVGWPGHRKARLLDSGVTVSRHRTLGAPGRDGNRFKARLPDTPHEEVLSNRRAPDRGSRVGTLMVLAAKSPVSPTGEGSAIDLSP